MDKPRFEVVESPVSKGERLIIEHMGEGMINQTVKVFGNPDMAKDICRFMNTPVVYLTNDTSRMLGEILEMFAEAGGGDATREQIMEMAIEHMHKKFKEAVR